MNRVRSAMPIALLLLAFSAGGAGGSVHVDDEEIVFRLTAPGAERVYVVGDFNGWNPTIDRLVDVDGTFEIRLYLLPGRYRYRFIVDGVSMQDPDNPSLAGDGNSVFHLLEMPAGLAISLTGGGEQAGREADGLSIAAELSAEAGGCRDALHAAARIEGRSGERIEARLTLGYEAEIRDDEIRGGEALFTEAAGIYHFGKGRLEAFTRGAELDFHDPASLFGRAGLLRYPLGSLCRGLLYEGRLPLGIEGTAFYASRLEEPAGGFEPSDGPVAGTLFDARGVADSDIIGLRLGGRIWRANCSYLMRRDKRPFLSPWAVSGYPEAYYTGYESVRVDGFMISIEGERSVTFESELLFGESRLRSLEIHRPAAAGESYEAEWEWQGGLRFYSGVRWRGERGGLAFSIDRTVLDGDPSLGERCADRERAVVRCAADVRHALGRIGTRGAAEWYGTDGHGELFWLRKHNFFLDGDDLTVGRLPFIQSSGIYEVEIFFVQPRGAESEGPDGGNDREVDMLAGPFALPLVVSFTERGDGEGDRVREMRFSKGADLHESVRLFADVRYVSYGIEGWRGERDYLDLFVALRAMIRKGSWISVGIGVNPSVYDGWLYRRTGYGRERCLMEMGLLDAYTSREELLGAVEEAERSLSEEWSITFEAFVRFW